MAKVSTVNVPASVTVLGFVPPELNTNEKAASLLENVPEPPKGLVRVRTLVETEQMESVVTGEVTEERAQEPVSTRVMEDGNVTLILEALGIL